MTQAPQAIDARDIWRHDDDACHLSGTVRIGDDARTSVVDTNCRMQDIANLWVCDGSVFPTIGGVNPSLTIQPIACRTADCIWPWPHAANFEVCRPPPRTRSPSAFHYGLL